MLIKSEPIERDISLPNVCLRCPVCGSMVLRKGAAARFRGLSGVAVNSKGEVFVSDFSGRTIRKIMPDGVVSTFAGKAEVNAGVDGKGADARFYGPIALTMDSAENLYTAARTALFQIKLP